MTEDSLPGTHGGVWRHWWVHVVWFLLGLFVGAITGARYLAQTEGAQVLLGGFLPPHQLNPRVLNYVKEGMTKAEVADRLNLQRVVVLIGSTLDEWKSRGGPSHRRLTEDEREKIVEVWFVPERQLGLTYFRVLCFDGSQKLHVLAQDDLILGFPTTVSDLSKQRPEQGRKP